MWTHYKALHGALIELLDPLCRFKIRAAIYGLNFNVHEAITGVKRMSRKRKEAKLYIPSTLNTDLDSFHLCLFDFHFIFQFYSILTTLVNSAYWNPADLFIFKSFYQHFKKKLIRCFIWKRNAAFAFISFVV